MEETVDVTPVLVFDRPKHGHFRRGAEVIARALAGQPLIDSLASAWPKLLRWRPAIVFQTADDYLIPFLFLAVARALLGRRSVAILTRNPSRTTRWRHVLRNWLVALVRHLPGVTALVNMAPDGPASAQGDWVFDTEWWDLQVAPLEACPVSLPRAQVVLAIGAVGRHKGLSFFLAAAERVTDENIRFVLVGDVSNISDSEIAQFQSVGGIVLPPVSDDRMFVSYIRQADWIWCCYHPTSDKSSGIFGRCLQLGKRSIVRKGSYLEPFQAQYGEGGAVRFGDVEELLEKLVAPTKWRPVSPAMPFRDYSIAQLRRACGFNA